MGAAKQKLNSERGASIVLALLFFLICAVIGGIVLASAASNAGRLSHMRQEQQAYLTVSSAAKLMRGELDGRRCTFVETSVDGDPPSLDFSPAAGALEEQLNAWASHIFAGGGIHPPDGSLAIESDLDTVSAVFSMDSDYNVTIVFSLVGSEQYPLTLKLFADKSEYTTSATVDVFDASEDVVGETTTVTTVTTITWSSPVITKGGAA